MNKSLLVTMLAALAFAGVAKAQTGSGTLGINATIQGSINLTFLTDANGMAVTGTSTSTASLPLGTVSMYGGTVPARFLMLFPILPYHHLSYFLE